MSLSTVAKIHPIVLYTIVDSYERRSRDQHRVIGSLLGTIDNGVIEITNCFCVPHNESQEEVAVELDFAGDMFELHSKVSPNDVIVGWFSTGHHILDHSLLIHDYYKRVVNNPIHLTVDTSLARGKIDFKCYTSINIGLPNKTPATMFARFPVELTSSAAEVVGVSALHHSVGAANRLVEPTSDLHVISEACTKTEARLKVLLDYVEGVMKEEVKQDPKVGRELMRMINKVPKMSEGQFEEMLNVNLKDLLMVVYLAQLTKVNVSINEKVTQVVGSTIGKDNSLPYYNH